MEVFSDVQDGIVKVYHDEENEVWKAKVSIEITTWGDNEEDARIEINKALDRFVKEVKDENKKKK